MRTLGQKRAKFALDEVINIKCNKKELSKLGDGLIRNIIKGNLIKGDLDFVDVIVNA